MPTLAATTAKGGGRAPELAANQFCEIIRQVAILDRLIHNA
jgi:hypothetical protein